jgi:hypothetical protein
MTNVHIGSSFDDFLREEGVYEEASATAAIRVLAWQLKQQIKEQGISKAELDTSRSQVDRLLSGDESKDSLNLPATRKSEGQRS